MKVLIISHMYPSTFNNVSGIFVHQQVKELINQGLEVKVVSPVPWAPFPIKLLSEKWKRYSEIPIKYKWENVDVSYPRYLEFPRTIFLPSSGRRAFNGIKKAVKEIYKGFKFSIIHSHVVLPDGYCGMLIAKRYKKPLILTIHGQDFYNTVFRNYKCKKNVEEVVNFSDKTILVSNSLKNVGEDRLNIKNDKLVVISNGIDLTEIQINDIDNIFRQKYRNKRIILSVGYLIERKGHLYIIEAIGRLIKKYPNIICLIGGDGSSEEKLKEITKRKKLENHVIFLGRINREEVMSLMSICEMFVLPSWNEAFGVVYLEAMIHEKPVIACKSEGPEEFIIDKKTGVLVKPKDIDNLVEAIDFLLSNEEKRAEIGKRAKRLVLEKYTWEKIAREIIRVYAEVLGK